MGAPLGSGRKHEFGNISGLRESEKIIIEVLFKWDHNASKASINNIALLTGISYSTVHSALQYLKKVRNIVKKSHRNSWFLPDYVKEDISKVLFSKTGSSTDP